MPTLIPGRRNGVFRVWIVAIVALVFAGCASLQPVDQPAEHAAKPSHSSLWESLEARHADSWFVLLNDGPTALQWRLRAIDSATSSIDLQTFLWTFDTTGALVLDRLIAAADRGVKIRLLIDDSFLAGEDAILLQLHRHPNIEYRVYNPFKRRADGISTRWALNLGEFDRLNHRMHNKSMVIDDRAAIVGGRNLADEYFGLHSQANFRDLELIAGGPIVQQVSDTFDEYWNDRWAIPIDMLSHVTTTAADLEHARNVRDQNTHLYVNETPQKRLEQWRKLVNSSRQGKATLLADQPPTDNPADVAEAPVQVADALVDLFNSAREEVLIVSAYLIPTKRLESVVGDAVKRGVRVRILTNSIASNNHLSAHSAYRNHINTLLNHGAELHEVRTDAQDRKTYMLSPVETKALALHAKALVVDHDRVFIGSANLDPRSLRINTEMGLVVQSPKLNADVRNAITPDFQMANAWQLQFDQKGQVVWVSDGKTLAVQPATSFMQRVEDWFFSHLPIEDEL